MNSGGVRKFKRLAGTNAAVVASAAFMVVCILASAAVVSGHAKTTDWITFATHQPGTGELCGHGLALVADGNHNKGFTRARTRSAKVEGLSGGACMAPVEKAPGNMKVRWQYFHRNDNHGWRLCRDIEMQHNQNVTAELTRYRDWEAKPCGHGFYRTEGRHGVTMGGNMRNGSTVSPDHHFGIND